MTFWRVNADSFQDGAFEWQICTTPKPSLPCKCPCLCGAFSDPPVSTSRGYFWGMLLCLNTIGVDKKQVCKLLFKWWKSVCLHLIYQSAHNAVFFMQRQWGEVCCSCVPGKKKKKNPYPFSLKALYVFPLHAQQKSGPSILHHRLVFLKRAWLRYPIGRSNSCR